MSTVHETLPSRTPEFQNRQRAFTTYLRDPHNTPCPGDVGEARMRVYRELILNNIDGVLSQAFPVLHRLCNASYWYGMVSGFLRDHQAQTPYFNKLPGEFLAYLEQGRENDPEDPPFLRELAHYEWVELALSLADPPGEITPPGREDDPLEQTLCRSPLAWLLSYAFPVQRIGPDYQPLEPPPQPTYLLVYRDPGDEIGFLELNPVTARLLELMENNRTRTGEQILEIIATELNHPEPQSVIRHGRAILMDLLSRGILFKPE